LANDALIPHRSDSHKSFRLLSSVWRRIKLQRHSVPCSVKGPCGVRCARPDRIEDAVPGGDSFAAC
jgi:hypothetical protein